MKAYALALSSTLLLTACGSMRGEHSSGDTPSGRNLEATGIYRVGDRVRYEVTRTGYTLASFFQLAEVLTIDGSKVYVKWTDSLDAAGADLVDWDNEKNPDVEEFDYNAPLAPASAAITYEYAAESLALQEVPAGSFECVKESLTATEGDSKSRVERCRSATVAITQNVVYERTYLDATGNSLKSFKKTLIENTKN